MKKLRLIVFVSGRGSNLRAILDNPSLRTKTEVCAIFSNKADCLAFKIADDFQIPTYIVPGFKEKERINSFIESVKALQPDLIVLAGYLKLIPAELTQLYPNRIINIHPALLPSFGGKGMYGINVHNAVFNSSAKVSGATIHFVNEKYDEGIIINQKAISIQDVNSPEEIAERVLKIEHILLPETIELFADNKIKIVNRRVIIN